MKLIRRRPRAAVIDIRTGEEVPPVPRTLEGKMDEIQRRLDAILARAEQQDGTS